MLFVVIWIFGDKANWTQFSFEVEVKYDQILNYLFLSYQISHGVSK